jgi:hypothetical protein
MSEVLDRIRSKITRAYQHIHDFQLACAAFLATNPYMISVKEDAEAEKRIYHLIRAEPVPDPVAAIAADVIQNLRSPLDQVIYQLVIAALPNGTEPEERIYFPIRDTSAHYPSAVGAIKKYVRKEVVDAIDTTEPYQGGKGHALWQLNALNTPDKHRLPLLAGSYFRSMDLTSGFKDMFASMGMDVEVPAVCFRPADGMMPLKVGDELYVEPLFETAPAIISPAAALRTTDDGRLKTKMHKDRQFRIDIAFNQPGIVECEPALKALQDIATLVDEVVTKLGSFLP